MSFPVLFDRSVIGMIDVVFFLFASPTHKFVFVE